MQRRLANEDGIHGWDQHHVRYVCSDGVQVTVPNVVVPLGRDGQRQEIPKKAVDYRENNMFGVRVMRIELHASKAEFDRSMKNLILGRDELRTITFPRTVRSV